MHGHGSGDGHTLLLATGELGRFEVGAIEPNSPFTLVFKSTGGAKLYSFWTGGADGHSGGYLAGGSPESATLRDEMPK